MATEAVAGDVRDLALAGAGEDLIEAAARETPALLAVRDRFARDRPLQGLRLAACMEVTPGTANLLITLRAAGADVALCASGPLATNDAVAAALALVHGIRTYAIRGEDEATHRSHVAAAISHRPDFTMDDGADLVTELHRDGGRLVDRVLGGTENGGAGAARLRAMAERGALRYPIVAVPRSGTVDAGLASQALSLEYLARRVGRLERRVHGLPPEVVREVARLALRAADGGIDGPAGERAGHAHPWEEGTR